MKFEIGHVLFVDIVGYSKLLIEDQKERLDQLTKIVLATAQVRDSTDEQLVRLPTGDGMALVFRHSAEEPARCALEIAEALQKHPELPVRMGIHSGPVSEVTDVSGRKNIAGAGINMAQRVMDCGDARHILLSQHVADDLMQYRQWAPRLRDLGECEVKHGVRLRLVNLYAEPLGNPEPPEKFRQTAASAPVSSAVLKPKRMPWHEGVVVALLVALLIGAGVFFFRQRPKSSVPTASPVAAVPDKSIAVLPFENLSEEKGNAYFAEGIQDEILTRLSKVAALKVISRTSTQKYKSAPDNLREVGQQLGVANILEGSVQKIANATHINVQLIRAATDEHVWAESYNRKLDDVFAVEGEVASAIADQLKAKLSGAEQKAVTDKPTENAAAYDAYLRGLAIEHNRYSFAAYQEAEASYLQAATLDPNFALAWSRVAVIRSFLYFNGVDPTRITGSAVKEAADRAFALRPDLGEAWVAQGAYKYRVLRDFPAAVEAYQEGGRRMPNNALVFEYLAYVERRMGRWKEAEEHYHKSADLDPLNLQLFVSMGSEFLNLLRRFDEAIAMLNRALQVSPNDESTHASIASIYQTMGRLDDARRELDKIPPHSTDPFVDVVRVSQLLYERRFDDAVTFLKRVVEATKPDEALSTTSIGFVVQLGIAQGLAGHQDEARATLTRAVQAIKPTPETKVPVGSLGLPNILSVAYSGLGDKENALAQAREAVADYATDAISKPGAEANLAQIQARFGDTESAIAALPHLLTVPAGLNPADLRNDPLWDPLRKDPRFQKFAQGK